MWARVLSSSIALQVENKKKAKQKQHFDADEKGECLRWKEYCVSTLVK